MLSGSEAEAKVNSYKVRDFQGQHSHPLSRFGGDYIYTHISATAVIVTDDKGMHITMKAQPKVDSNPTFSIKSEYIITMKSLRFNQEGYAISFREFWILEAVNNVPIPGFPSPLNARLDSKEIELGQKEGESHLLVRLHGSKLRVEVDPSKIKKPEAGKLIGAAQRFFTRTTITGILEVSSDLEIASHKKYLE